MGFNEISANGKPFFRMFSSFSFSLRADNDGKVGRKILFVMLRLQHSLNIVVYFKTDYREYLVCVWLVESFTHIWVYGFHDLGCLV